MDTDSDALRSAEAAATSTGASASAAVDTKSDAAVKKKGGTRATSSTAATTRTREGKNAPPKVYHDAPSSSEEEGEEEESDQDPPSSSEEESEEEIDYEEEEAVSEKKTTVSTIKKKAAVSSTTTGYPDVETAIKNTQPPPRSEFNLDKLGENAQHYDEQMAWLLLLQLSIHPIMAMMFIQIRRIHHQYPTYCPIEIVLTVSEFEFVVAYGCRIVEMTKADLLGYIAFIRSEWLKVGKHINRELYCDCIE